MKKTTHNLFIVAAALMALMFAQVSFAQNNMCIGIRGNGFKIVSTLNAIARITEEAGVPDKLLGGSSGSVAMFLTDSAAMNPWISQIGVDPKLSVSLMLKAVPEFLSEIANLPEFVIASELMKDKKQQGEAKEIMNAFGEKKGISKISYAAWKFATSPTFRSLAKVKSSIYLKDLIDADYLKFTAYTKTLEQKLKKVTDPAQKAKLEAQIAFRSSQSKNATSNLTSFGVMDQDNMFFTPGFISVVGIAKMASRAASFYAGYNMNDPQDQMAMKNWLKKCAPLAEGKTFDQLVEIEPSCSSDLKVMAAKYIRQYDELAKLASKKKAPRWAKFRDQDLIGTKIDTYAVVATVVGPSVKTYFDTLKKYEEAVDSSVGRGFSIDPKDFKYGYFGNPETFNRSVETLKRSPIVDSSGRTFDFTQDYKTNLAHALGRQTWLQAIHSSGSEPSKTRPISLIDAEQKSVITVGGWADGYPAHILKGMGCSTTVIIVTNSKPGISLSENTIQKLMPTLTGFKTLTPDENAYGNSDQTSDFGQWRNVGNPESSEGRSANAADAVYCSLWNDEVPFDSKLGFKGSMSRLSDVGYNAKLFIPENVATDHPARSWKISNVNRDDLKTLRPSGAPLYLGCILPASQN